MPDNESFEAMIENELNSLVEQSKDSTKFTSLEAKLMPIAVKHANKRYDYFAKNSLYNSVYCSYFYCPPDLVKKIINSDILSYVKAALRDYISLVESCAKETGETFEEKTRKVGYHTALITNEQEKKNVETMLEELHKFGLVQISDKITSATRITACHLCDKTEAHPKELHSVYTGCYSYKITDYCKELLDEHRESKRQKGE